MTEQNISFKVVMLAKEKGFVPYCQTSNRAFRFYTNQTIHGVDNRVYYQLMCEMQKWLREEHQIHLHITTADSSKKGVIFHCMVLNYAADPMEYKIIPFDETININGLVLPRIFESYEEALEIGLFEALKLIK